MSNVICDKDCLRRHPGCHDHCAEYIEKSTARRKQIKEYEQKLKNPYCRHWTDRDVKRSMKKKLK